MESIGKISGFRVLRLLTLIGLTGPLLVNPSVLAGHLPTSPAEIEEVADPDTVDGVAIRGSTARSSTGPNDIPVGLAGFASGNADGEGGRVFAIRGATSGNAVGTQTRVRAVGGVAEGNATALGSRIEGVFGDAQGNATETNAAIRGVFGTAEGSATGLNASIQGVVGDAEAHAGSAIGVFGIARFTPAPPGSSGFAAGVLGFAETSPGVGVAGRATATSGFVSGVQGESASTQGNGGFFRATATSGNTSGVGGESASTQGNGGFFRATAASGNTIGVIGESLSSSGTGVDGRNLSTTGLTIGVRGESRSPDGRGVIGFNSAGGLAGEFIGNVTISGNLSVTGTKSFVQPHPTQPSKEIFYVSLEGPEVGTYIRGTAQLINGESVINLPEHFSLITNDNGLTVQLTPLGEWLQIYVVQQNAEQIVVREARGKSGKFHYLVQGIRKGYENHRVVREKLNSDVATTSESQSPSMVAGRRPWASLWNLWTAVTEKLERHWRR